MKNNITSFALYNKVLRLGGGAALLFIALCLLLSCNPSTPGGSGENAGAISSDYYYDSSTNTYHIYTEQGLNAWAESDNCLTANVILQRNITLTQVKDDNGSTWNGIGDDNNGYRAIFDGNGYTITNVRVVISTSGLGNQRYGFFRSIESGGEVKDLSLENIYISNVSGYIGGIAGFSDGGRISNCIVSGTISSGALYAGGIIGNTFGANTTTILNCINHCDVISKGQSATAGGIAGWAGSCNISGCDNYGDITVRGYNSVQGGGIAGYILNTAVNSCLNRGNIIGENTANTPELKSSQKLYSGAIVGAAYSSTIKDCTIEEGCTIEATYNSDYVGSYSFGSIVGNGEGADSSNTGEAEINEFDLSTDTTT